MTEGVAVIAHVVVALMLRETKTRYGRHRGGYLWAVAEPIIYIALFVLISEAAGRTAARDGSTAANFASGVLAFMLFRDIVQRCMTAVSGNRGLLMHPVVTPLDIVVARTLLEVATSLVVTGIVALGIAALWGNSLPASPLFLLGVLLVATLLGLPFGLLFGAASGVWPVIERLVAPLMRVAFLASGVFFVPASMPSEVRAVLLWNPVLHVTEAARGAWFAVPPETYGSLCYPIAIAWLLLPFGLAAERVARSRNVPA